MQYNMLFLQLTNLSLGKNELQPPIKLAVDCRAISAQDSGKQGQGSESPGLNFERT
jgi:hypothetical protein